ncbi:MAG: ABC-type transport auxiliary lipoprotein family protein [Desulfobacterales bacterium]|nr:ABC-type transport auxiliary lipoprotein family protein [Desulfobacterales bacterium]
MIRKRCFFLTVLAVALISAGCATLKRPALEIEYYTLEYDSPAVDLPGATGPLAALLRVERFSAAPPYETNRIVFRERQFDLDTYFYHRWRAVPADLVSYFLTRDLQQSGLFKAVSPSVTTMPHTHVVAATVDEFLEWDTDRGRQAVITLHLSLIVAREPDISKRVLFQERFTARYPCGDKQPREVARAMSLAMADISRQVAIRIHQALSTPAR